MTVVKGDVRGYKMLQLPMFIDKQDHMPMTIALIPPVSAQMAGFLARLCNNLVRDQEKPLFLDGACPVIPTTDENGKMYVQFNIATQNYELALRLDNYVVQQTIPESAYV